MKRYLQQPEKHSPAVLRGTHEMLMNFDDCDNLVFSRAGQCSNVPWTVIHVQALPDYELTVEFIDGVKGQVQMREMVFSEHAGVFSALRDQEVFADVGIFLGAVTWANGLDLAPDAMHDEIAKNGVWVLD